MSKRQATFDFLKEYGAEATLVIAALSCVAFIWAVTSWQDWNAITGKFVAVAVATGAVAANLVAFVLVLCCPPAMWGELKPFKFYFGLGGLIGVIASVVAVVQLFKVG